MLCIQGKEDKVNAIKKLLIGGEEVFPARSMAEIDDMEGGSSEDDNGEENSWRLGK